MAISMRRSHLAKQLLHCADLIHAFLLFAMLSPPIPPIPKCASLTPVIFIFSVFQTSPAWMPVRSTYYIRELEYPRSHLRSKPHCRDRILSLNCRGYRRSRLSSPIDSFLLTHELEYARVYLAKPYPIIADRIFSLNCRGFHTRTWITTGI